MQNGIGKEKKKVGEGEEDQDEEDDDREQEYEIDREEEKEKEDDNNDEDEDAILEQSVSTILGSKKSSEFTDLSILSLLCSSPYLMIAQKRNRKPDFLEPIKCKINRFDFTVSLLIESISCE